MDAVLNYLNQAFALSRLWPLFVTSVSGMLFAYFTAFVLSRLVSRWFTRSILLQDRAGYVIALFGIFLGGISLFLVGFSGDVLAFAAGGAFLGGILISRNEIRTEQMLSWSFVLTILSFVLVVWGATTLYTYRINLLNWLADIWSGFLSQIQVIGAFLAILGGIIMLIVMAAKSKKRQVAV